jgi:large subunit ribosomal protein L21
MYAIVKTGGKQYRVERGQRLLVERLPAEEGASVALQPLLFRSEKAVLDKAGLESVKVTAKVIAHERGQKLRVFKFKPKRGYKRRTGHRQNLTRIEVTELELKTGSRAKAEPVKADQPAAKADKAAPKATRAPAKAKADSKEAAAKASVAETPAEATTVPKAKAPAKAKAKASGPAASRPTAKAKPTAAKAKPSAAKAKPTAAKPKPTADGAEKKPAKPKTGEDA